jgi:hypothetical protein
MNDAAIDHLIVGIADLEEGIRLFAELAGVMAERGGRHPSLGTHNALLSLGLEPIWRSSRRWLAPRRGWSISLR